MKVIITSPSLDTSENISGISSVVKFIIESNPGMEYVHFELGRHDDEKRNLAWLLRILSSYLRWFRILWAGKDTMVHFNMALCKFSIIRDFPMLLMARLFRRKMIIHLHGGDYLEHKEPPAWMRILWKISFSGRNPVIVLSPAEMEILNKRIARERIHTLPNCISLHEAYEFERNYAGDESVNLLFMGRISTDKGLEFIYKALVSLKRKGVNFRFILAGRGPDQDEYSRKFRELLGSSFEFTGVITGELKTAVLKRCNVFVLPSFYEGLPMALLESMSFGLVPVTTNVGSIGQIVTHGENGLFVKSHSSSDIEFAVEELASNWQFRQQLSRNARQFIFENFSPESYVSKLNEIYSHEQEH